MTQRQRRDLGTHDPGVIAEAHICFIRNGPIRSVEYRQILTTDGKATGVFTNPVHPGKRWTFPLDRTLTTEDPMNFKCPGMCRVIRMAMLDNMAG